MKIAIKDMFLKLMLNILKDYVNSIMIYHFLTDRAKTVKLGKPVANLHDKKLLYT